MTDLDPRIATAGWWLAGASAVFVVSLALHPPPSPDLAEFMTTIANSPTRWVVVHWLAALALTGFAITGLLVLTARSPITRHRVGASGWALLIVGAIWVSTTAVAEATVITAVAVAGDSAMFEVWHLFAEGKAFGFGMLAGAFALIGGTEAMSDRSITPTWATWIGTAAAVAAFIGFIGLALLLGIAIGSVIWLFSTIVMSLWAIWFGIGLARSTPRGDSTRTGELESPG